MDSNNKDKAKNKKKMKTPRAAKSNGLNSLAWTESLQDEDPFSFLVGGTEGGFLALEEIDEGEYGFIGGVGDSVGAGEDEDKKGSFKAKSKKRKRGSGDGDSSLVLQAEGNEKDETVKQKKKIRKKDKRKKKRDSKKIEDKDGEMVEGIVEDAIPVLAETTTNADGENDANDNLLLDEDEVYAWKELRLHPMLMKSIRKLGFKEPTPIQKACIPAAAHQGKDVIGAAETGSGKTLAFGFPILQRLLEEQEKATRSLDIQEKAVEIGFQGGPLRALIITPTRELALQVSDHLKEAAKFTEIKVVPIVGGMSTEKQERLLRRRPEIIVGTPGRLWELMSGGDQHLVELHLLSFFVLDEADRMIENGHFHELQSIIDMLPSASASDDFSSQPTQVCKIKKRQTFVFSATIALSANFRKKLKRGLSSSRLAMIDGLSSIEKLSKRAGMRADAAIVDLTNASVVAHNLEESFIECSEEDKEAYLYYILRVHGLGRTIVFCTSIAALRRISSMLRVLGINAWTLHAQMQQRARLKAVDRFRGNDHAVLIATDLAARGLDIPGIRTVVHYQLPHSAEVYVHRSGRTARASADGCCIVLVSPNDKKKFFTLCKALCKENFQSFPVDDDFMPEVMKRLSLARQIDKILRKNAQENAKKSWLERCAESVELGVEDSGSEEEIVKGHKDKKMSSLQVKKLQKELNDHLARPLQPKAFSQKFFAGTGVSPLLQQQLEELSKRKLDNKMSKKKKRAGLVVIGHDLVEPLQALRSSGREVCVNVDKMTETRRHSENLKKKHRDEKKRVREQRRKAKKKKEGMY